MSPCWDKDLQKKAQDLGKVLIPGVYSPSEIHQALNFGCRILKLFPASNLGLNYLKNIQSSFTTLPFIIAAGGIKIIDIDEWINQGFNAIVLGRDLIKKNQIDPLLNQWLTRNKQ